MTNSVVPDEMPLRSPTEPSFHWIWFFFWTILTAFVTFVAVTLLVGQRPPQPLLIHEFRDVLLGQLVLLLLIACTVVYCAYFLAFAVLPGVGPRTWPTRRKIVAAMTLLVAMTFLLFGATFSDPNASIEPFTQGHAWSLLSKILVPNATPLQKEKSLAAWLLMTLTLAFSTSAVVSNLITSMRGCIKEDVVRIRSFLLLMHGTLAVIIFIYTVLLYKTNVRVAEHSSGTFIMYFLLLYTLITILTFFIPALQYRLFDDARSTITWFGGITIPPWLVNIFSSSFLENIPIIKVLIEQI